MDRDPARHGSFLAAEFGVVVVLPSMGTAVSMAKRSIGGWDRMRSPPTVRLASAVLVAARVPKAELEEPTFGALARERLAERGTRGETQ
jgi:hypothetical protein